MFDQRNQQFSTILLATTFMICALISPLAEGVLPEITSGNLGDFVYYMYSISTSVATGFLFMCLIFCVETMWRASRFMYKRSKYHSGYLAKAIKKTKEMMSAIRGVKVKHQDPLFDNGKEIFYDNGERNFSKMTRDDVEKEFIGYESEINHYHEGREAMIDDSAYMVTADDGSVVESKSFEVFWQDSCSFYGNCAVLSFYAGSFALYFTNVTYMWSYNLYVYHNVSSAKVSVYVILLSLLTTISLLIYIRYFEKISMDNSNNEDDDDEKFSWGAFGANSTNWGSFGVTSSSRLSLPRSSISLKGISQFFSSDYDNEKEDNDDKQNVNNANLNEFDTNNNGIKSILRMQTNVRIEENKNIIRDSRNSFCTSLGRNREIPIAVSLDIPLEPVEYQTGIIY
jgi:hypothetical protein